MSSIGNVSSLAVDIECGDKSIALTTLIRFSGLQKNFESRTILQSIDLELRAGECHLLLGENGAGKSTLLRVMAGLLKPEGGMVESSTSSLAWAKARQLLRDQVMYLHQTPYLFDGTVTQNLNYAKPTTKSHKAESSVIQEVLEWGGLEKLANSPAKQLSGGEKQRLALARARLRQAPVLLLDEPTSNLDQYSRERTLALLSSLREEGVSMIIACHEIAGFDAIADGKYRLSNGRLSMEEV